jgi:hypothetical protein
MTDWRPAEETEKQMAELMDKPNIHQRIAAVRADLPGGGYMQKNAFVSTGGNNGYNALTYDKLIGVVGPLHLRHGINVEANLVESSRVEGRTKNGGFMLRYSALFDVRFINVDNPKDVHTQRVEADANDNGDKAPPKAKTVAKRIAIRDLYDIQTGEDEEQRTEELAAPEEEAKMRADEYATERLAAHKAALDAHGEAVKVIAVGIEEFWASGDFGMLKDAADAWFPLDKDVKEALFLAPTKGGCFTTEQRAFMRKNEFRDAHYGERQEAAA